MTSLPQNPDVIVIGAGAAGIAAGRVLRDRGVDTLVLEARDRIGGRAWTMAYEDGPPLDLGCEWLHSADRNVLAAIAPTIGFGLDKSEPPWRRSSDQANFRMADQQAFGAAQSAFEARVQIGARRGRETGSDTPAADFLEPAGRWNGLLDAISTYYNGAPLERVSVVDYDAYEDTETDWRVIGGYGTLIGALGKGLPIRRNCPVHAVDLSGPTVTVTIREGTLTAKAVIVTVPTSVLASGAIRFSPACDDHLAAAAVLPLGLADKLYMAIEEPEAFAWDTRLIGATDRRDTGSYTLRPRGRPLLEGYFGGDFARTLEKEGLPAFAAVARADVAKAFGADAARHLKPILATGWASDPLSLGSYSHALPGHAAARATLAEPVDERLVFAGEATSPHFFSTAHGAFETGLAAGAAMASYVLRHEA